MEAVNRSARFVGICFIVATAAGVAAVLLGSPIANAPDYLHQMAAREGVIRLEAVLIYIMSAACAGVGLGMYPILHRYGRGLAIGAAGFRLIESVTQVISGATLIALLALSKEFVGLDSPDNALIEVLGAVIKAGDDWLTDGVMLLSWCIGAFIYYFLFFRYRLVPRWLSVWGLIGLTLTSTGSILVMLGLLSPMSALHTASNAPIALQEMVFAVWLIVRGVKFSGGNDEESET